MSAPEVAETSATDPAAAVADGQAPAVGRQATAVTSRTPGGAGTGAQVAPPSSVTMITAWPLDGLAACPTAVQWVTSLQAMPDR